MVVKKKATKKLKLPKGQRPFEKIYKHPDRTQIIKKLKKDGESVRSVEAWLREKYPEDKKLQVSFITLQKFRNEKLHIEKSAVKEIREAQRDKIIEKQELEKQKQIGKELENNEKRWENLPIYKQLVRDAVDYHVSIEKELKEILILIKSRTEDLFDKASAGKITINEEANLQKYFQTVTLIMDRWAKYVEKIADQRVETNINITVIEDQVAVLRDAIKETFQEVAPELMPVFLDRLSSRMEMLRYRRKPEIDFKGVSQETKMIGEAVKDLEYSPDLSEDFAAIEGD